MIHAHIWSSISVFHAVVSFCRGHHQCFATASPSTLSISDADQGLPMNLALAGKSWGLQARPDVTSTVMPGQ